MWKSISGVPVNGNQWWMWKSHKVIHYCPLLFGYGIAQKSLLSKRARRTSLRWKSWSVSLTQPEWSFFPRFCHFCLFLKQKVICRQGYGAGTHTTQLWRTTKPQPFYISQPPSFMLSPSERLRFGLPPQKTGLLLLWLHLHVISNQGSHSSAT